MGKTIRFVGLMLVVVSALVLTRSIAVAQRPAVAELRVNGDGAYAGMPFELVMTVKGFAETPVPALPKLAIAGAQITPLEAVPHTMSGMEVRNGQRRDIRETTWALRWRVVVERAGRLNVPALTVTQGGQSATTRSAVLEVEDVPTTRDMKLELVLPARAVWVGETIPVELVWLLRRSPSSQSFSVPLFSMPGMLVAAPAAANARQALPFAVGGSDLQLPYDQDEVDVDGSRYSRFRFYALLTPTRAGTIQVAPATVAAGLEVGRRDFFGSAPTRMFAARDVERKLEIKELPQTGRPSDFAGAVGSAFALAVRASRSVVQLGEPVELELTVTSADRLDALALPRLEGAGGLSPSLFRVPPDSPPGELSPDAKRKVFRLSVQVVGPATEIPALGLPYFDPVKAIYQVARSEPIALSVKGGTMVGAQDVVAAPGKQSPSKSDGSGAGASPASPVPGGAQSLVGADLALSSVNEALSTAAPRTWLWYVIGFLYLAPLGIATGRFLSLRNRKRRAATADFDVARRRALAALQRARQSPAREVGGELVAALRQLVRASQEDGAAQDVLLTRIETEAFAPTGASAPLPAAVVAEAEAMVKAVRARRQEPAGVSVGVAVLLVATLGASSTARADSLSDGRSEYQAAMGESDASVRRAKFARAAEAFEKAASQHASASSLLADWGNAALGAGDVATATLAYRRALAADPSSARAQRNLSWLRSRQEPDLRAASADAADTLFFFHRWPVLWRWLIGAVAFAGAVLLLTFGRVRWLRGLASVPALIWFGMVASIALAAAPGRGAVVMDGSLLRAADSTGAPAARTQPLPPGTEIELLERRGSWHRVRIASGTTGWLPDGALRSVAPE